MILKNKFLLTFLTIFLLSSACFAVPPKKNPIPSDFYTGISWQEAQKSDKPMVLNFYVDWCSACKRFAPILDNVRKDYESKYNFVIVKHDDPKNKEFVDQYPVMSYPSVYLVDNKTGKRIFVNQRKYFNPEEFKKELDDFLK